MALAIERMTDRELGELAEILGRLVTRGPTRLMAQRAARKGVRTSIDHRVEE